jgi:AcrR family transcriptional regulator
MASVSSTASLDRLRTRSSAGRSTPTTCRPSHRIENPHEHSSPCSKGHPNQGETRRGRQAQFTKAGYTEASIVPIIDEAGVGQGTCYLYFGSKLEVFNEVVEDLNRRVRHAMTSAAVRAPNRAESERAGFRAFFTFTAEHPALYRIIRQAEFVSPGALRLHHTPHRRQRPRRHRTRFSPSDLSGRHARRFPLARRRRFVARRRQRLGWAHPVPRRPVV